MRESDDAHVALLEAAYRAEFSAERRESEGNDALVEIAGRRVRVGDLRAMAIDDLATRVSESSLLRRADDTAKVAALAFVERRVAEGAKIAAYDRSGSFQGFLRRVIANLLLDWLRSPAGRAELRRAEHDGSERFEPNVDATEPELASETSARDKRLALHNLVAIRAIRSLPPGRGVPLRLSLWPSYQHDAGDVTIIGGFAHCHETSRAQADARACDAGRRCTTPTDAWTKAYDAELDGAKQAEPEGLSRKAIAVLTRIGHGKPMPKREGAICERISKARLQLVEELRRSGIRGVES